MKRFVLLLLLACCVAGCSKKKEITPLNRKQGAALASEASFAISVRDFARAEGLLAQATEVCPDNPDYWVGLGTARRKQDNRAGAKEAFQTALNASRDIYKRDSKNSQSLLQQVYLLALLGKIDDARDTLEKARKNHPDDRNVRAFVEGKQLDRLLADPAFKDLSP